MKKRAPSCGPALRAMKKSTQTTAEQRETTAANPEHKPNADAQKPELMLLGGFEISAKAMLPTSAAMTPREPHCATRRV